ncbi:MAG: S8 family serine peptidase [candidate division WOR-3 bacterium]
MLISILSAVYINGHEAKISTIGSGKYHIVEMRGPILDNYKTTLLREGIKLYDYLYQNAFIIKANDKQLSKISKFDFVKSIYPILPEYKLPLDYKEKLNSCYVKENDKYKVRILFYDYEDTAEILNFLKKRDTKIDYIDKFVNYIQTYLTLDEISEIINLEGVKFVEFQYPIINWNNRDEVLHQSGLFLDVQNSTNSNDTIVWKKGIHGEGEILGHNDDGLDRNHCFFSGTVGGQNKIVDLCNYNAGGCGVASLPAGTNCNTNPGTGCHGTHTAGTAVGYSSNANAPSMPYRGMAPMARIVSQTPLGGGGSGFATVLNDAYNRGARVHTNSWGYICGSITTMCSPTSYNTDARTIDLFVWNNPDMVVVFAAGNHGDDSCQSGCNRTASDPATAKNDITVGAMARAIDAKMGWSAYGNYPSGRFSVDVMAKGDTTYSAWGGTACGITNAWWWMGTSMATPVVAGSAILMRQYYAEGWYGNGTKNSAPSINPSSNLIKASLLASAVPIAHDGDVPFGNEPSAPNNPAPNGNEGAGRLVLDNVMYFMPEDDWLTPSDSSDIRKSKLYFVDNTSGISTGQTQTYTINLCKNMLTRIVLVWNDYPASTNCNSSNCLVNDLDLRVEKGSDFWLGNVRPTTTTPGNIDTTRMNVNTPDRANNWEIVRLLPPKDTTYTIKVIGYNVPQGPQKYALVVSGGIGCSVTPVKSDEKQNKIYEKIGNNLIFNAQKPMLVRIYNSSGYKVLEQFIPAGISKIDISNFSKGAYIISIYEENKLKLTDKIVK